MHNMGKTVIELHAMLKLHEQTLPPKDVAPALHAIRSGRRRNSPIYLVELMKRKKLSQGASTSGITKGLTNEQTSRARAKHLGDDVYKWANLQSSFYAVFDGHGGAEAASYVKNHAMRLFFDDILILPEATNQNGSVDEFVLKRVNKTFILQNKKGRRVEELGGYFEDGYLNGELSVTRALGDRCMKSKSPLIAEPEMTEIVLTDDDEFMIIGCDGIWDVMSNEEAVSLVRKQLMQHNDPQRCATKLINQALRLHTSDNLTAIVVCFSSHIEPPKPWRPRRGFRDT
ncbi:probable protein phosphatase 2C 47 [Tanacetum coccineum]